MGPLKPNPPLWCCCTKRTLGVVVQRPKHALERSLQPKRTLRWLHNRGGEEVEMMEMKVVAASDMVVMLEAVRVVTRWCG
ncbi:hypothetical protein Tco_1201645 [Tanacetum coccineum]